MKPAGPGQSNFFHHRHSRSKKKVMTRTSGWADSFCVVLWRDHGSSFAHLMPVSSDSSTDADMHPHVSMDAQQATSNSSLSHSFGKSAVSTGAFETNQSISPLASNVGSIWNTLSNGVCSSIHSMQRTTRSLPCKLSIGSECSLARFHVLPAEDLLPYYFTGSI